ncbi:MAG: hypothetical protein IJN25_04070 [Clostridia bacterium]|nr:hypothetical protein [Oscillospiraceae bacterium]MBQ7032819.1 hypothetical protein [Clostridia bacterium]
MANAPEDMLKNILGNPAAMEQIMGLMQSFKSGETTENEPEAKKPSPPALPFGLDNPETLMKLGSAFGKIANDDDPRINLLMAIRPYLNEKRLKSADQAMQILKLSKMSSLFEELKIL